MHYEEDMDVKAIERVRMGDSFLCLSSKTHEDVKNWASGQEYEVTLKVKQVESELMEDGSVKAKFEVLSAQNS